MRRCSECGQEKDPSEFYRRSPPRTGLYSDCKSCRIARTTARRRANPERTRELSRARYAADPVRGRERTYRSRRRYPERVNEWHRTHRERVRELNRLNEKKPERRAYKARWAAENRERTRAYTRKWMDANHEKVLELVHRRRVRMAAAAGSFTAAQLAARVAYYGWRCWMCGAPWEEIDHVKPLARGGSNWPVNLRPSCKRCNRSKGARQVA